MTAEDQRYRATERVAAKEVGGELVLLDLEEGSFFVARGTGPRVWKLVEGGASLGEVVRAVAERYGKDEDEARADVEAFVADLVRRGFLAEAS